MRTNRWGRWLGVLAVLALVGAGACADEPKKAAGAKKVEVKAVKYGDIEKTIQGFKGKVVVVDYWAEWCGPCKRGLPHLAELHDKHAKDGLVVVTVNLDDPTDKDALKRATQFLEDKKLAFTNLSLHEDEKVETWIKQLGITAIPVTEVYDREGNKADRLVGLDPGKVDKLVEDLLKKK